MDFRPRMISATEGISLCADLAWQAGDGFVADVWHARGGRGGGGHYVSPDPRIVVFLDAGGGAVELAAAPGRFRPAARAVFVPAGMPLWSRIAHDAPFRHLDLHLDRARIAERLEGRLPEAAWERPLLEAGSAPLVAHARAIARACRQGAAAEGEVLALVARLLVPGAKARPALSPRQLSLLRDHAEACLAGPIGVPDLARLAGLSESWFAHSFKRATGVPPHRWLRQLRLARAQRLIEGSDLPLAAVAAEAGFADQAHLTRSFRGLTGQTPGAWRRAGAARAAADPPPGRRCPGGAR